MKGVWAVSFQPWQAHCITKPVHSGSNKNFSNFELSLKRTFVFLSALLLFVLQFEAVGAGELRNLRLDEAESRIVGGTEATRDFSFTTALYGSNPSIGSICGGMLILPDVVMTAAHCTGFIHVARTNLHSKYDDSGEQFDVDREATRNHPEYSGNQHDVALLKLKGVSKVQPVLLNGLNSIPAVGDTVRVMGWGRLSSGGSSATNLQQVDVNAISNTKCNQMYSGMITDDMLCAMVEGGGKDACQGDSGGPLIVANDAVPSEDLLVGVVSWGYGCAGPNHPGVYSRISNQIDWIRENACQMTDVGGINCPIRIRLDEPTPNPPPIVIVPIPPSMAPVESPVDRTTTRPTRAPVDQPTATPSLALTASPTRSLSHSPSHSPSSKPSFPPSTSKPTTSVRPSFNPTPAPSRTPSSSPTNGPTSSPTVPPSVSPSNIPTSSVAPTRYPSESPSNAPTGSSVPSVAPSSPPSSSPSGTPSSPPTGSFGPSAQPTTSPSSKPTSSPTSAPTAAPFKTAPPSIQGVRSMSQFEQDCQDTPGTFDGPHDTVRDCEWVGKYRFGRCLYYCGLCPITCFDGQKDACLSRSRTCKGDYGFV